MPHFHVECKYCDNPTPYLTSSDEIVCGRCGAEWEDAKIRVEVSDEEYEFMMDEFNEAEKEYDYDHRYRRKYWQ